MRVPTGLGQDATAEPTDRSEWRTNVQIHVRLLPADVQGRGLLWNVPWFGGEYLVDHPGEGYQVGCQRLLPLPLDHKRRVTRQLEIKKENS